MNQKLNQLKQFLEEGYAFRRNLLSGKMEFCERCAASVTNYRTLTVEDINSILLAAEEALPDAKNLRKTMEVIIYSRQTPDYDPAKALAAQLPEWDGKNHVGALLDRLPGLRAEQRYWMSVWLRSMWAHWLDLDQTYGNDLVPTLIGQQGCGKSTFCRMLLPEELRSYYLDHVNLSNKFDKEMALTNNLIVNIDELDQVRRAQQASLKQLVSKSRVNGRPIYGRTQADRRRYASFVATTNNLHPLHDPTGSRRYLCIEIPAGTVINNETPIDYGQLYAQIVEELRRGERYWLTAEETRSMERANEPYQSTQDMERMVMNCFRRPAADEVCQPLSMSDIADIVTRQYPFVLPTQSTKVQLGLALSARGFKHDRDKHARYYYVVPLDVA